MIVLEATQFTGNWRESNDSRIVTKTPHEYIRVTYEYIRLHTTKYGSIQVIYEYSGYIGMHRSNIQ